MKPKRLLSLGVLLICFTAAASLAGAEKPVPPQPTELQKLKERVDALEAQLKDAQAKADKLDSNIKAAAIEKDYVERIQKEVNAYYEKAFNTQLATVTIIALIVGLIGKFGVDHIVQSKLTEAATTLREGFRKELADELQKLRESNAAQMKQLEDDLKLRSDWQFQFLQGMTNAIGNRADYAAGSFRRAVQHYKSGKPRGVLESAAGEVSISNLFESFSRDPEKESDRDTRAREELKSDLFNGLEDELAQASLRVEWLGALIKERKQGPPAH